jgi:hypothetical protein
MHHHYGRGEGKEREREGGGANISQRLGVDISPSEHHQARLCILFEDATRRFVSEPSACLVHLWVRPSGLGLRVGVRVRVAASKFENGCPKMLLFYI